MAFSVSAYTTSGVTITVFHVKGKSLGCCNAGIHTKQNVELEIYSFGLFHL